jgi:hypothetical protein
LVFNNISTKKDVIAWTAMMSAYPSTPSPFFGDAVHCVLSVVCRVLWCVNVLACDSVASIGVVITVLLQFLSFSFIFFIYNLNNKPNETISLFQQMKTESTLPNAMTYACILGACSDLKNLNLGKRFHSQLYTTQSQYLEIEMVQNALVTMYMKCGDSDTALQVSFTAIYCNYFFI